MKIRFTKMQGCGNDYIYINCFDFQPENLRDLSVQLSDRHYGIGGDGVIFIMPSSEADAKMRMFNSDGSEGKMCGNGIRCVGKYIFDKGIVKETHIYVETLSGVKELFLTVEKGFVSAATVNMGKPELPPKKIPVNLPGEAIINRAVRIGGQEYNITCLSMGNPHAVVFCSDVAGLDLAKIGSVFEKSSLFPEGVNTEFVKIVGSNQLEMRVWERGSGETLACGTGACACAVAAILNGYCPKGEDIKINLLGGQLSIKYIDGVVFMTGDCRTVFEGSIDI